MNISDYTFVSYNGGSAGDLFVTSCNGIELVKMTGISVPTQYSLKEYERSIYENDLTVEQAISSLPKPPNGFVSTHLYEQIIAINQKMVNIVITDPLVQDLVVLRQMKIQRLAIKVNPNESWYNIVKTLCLNEKYNKAAAYWFEQSKRVWMQDMNKRVSNIYGKNLNFNSLFTEKFTDSLIQQGWETNTDILRSNHKQWIKKNSKFNKDETLDSIAKKLSTMNWNSSSGYVDFVA